MPILSASSSSTGPQPVNRNIRIKISAISLFILLTPFIFYMQTSRGVLPRLIFCFLSCVFLGVIYGSVGDTLNDISVVVATKTRRGGKVDASAVEIYVGQGDVHAVGGEYYVTVKVGTVYCHTRLLQSAESVARGMTVGVARTYADNCVLCTGSRKESCRAGGSTTVVTNLKHVALKVSVFVK